MRASYRSTGRALSLAAAAWLAPAVVLAEPPDSKAPAVHVLRISSDDADAQAEALTVQLKSGLRAMRGWALGATDFSLDVLSLALQCGELPDARCQAKIADQIHADRYIWGTLKKTSDRHVVADLHLWSRDGTTASSRITYSDNLTVAGDDALRKIAAQALTELTGGPARGEVVVRTAADGEIFVDGQPMGRAEGRRATLALPPGDHRIELRSGGVAVESGAVTVLPEAHLEIALAPRPGGAVPGAPEEPEQAASSSWKGTAGWISVGVGGALLATGVYGLVRVQGIQHDGGFDAYRKGFRSGQDVCEVAAHGFASSVPGAASPSEVISKCDTASTMTTLQLVGFGLGAVATGAGIYFLATAPSHDGAPTTARRWGLTPAVGPRGGGVDVRVAF
jgi:hypothetical protein